MTLLGVSLSSPSLPGLLRMLGFTLGLAALVFIVDGAAHGGGAVDNAISLMVGGFSGFALRECGVSFARHGWRAFALVTGCSLLLFGTLSLAL